MMGDRITPECDIFKTLQPKGLRRLQVAIAEMKPAVAVEGAPDWEVAEGSPLFDKIVAVGTRGAERVLRMVEAATEPPKKQKDNADVRDA